MTELGVFEAIYTARALRQFKPDPVPEEAIEKILEAAIHAPSAGNAQNWIFIIVREPEQRKRLGAIYRKASAVASAMYAARGHPPHMTEEQFQRFLKAGAYLWEHMSDAPVILLPCQFRPTLPPTAALAGEFRERLGEEESYLARIRGASIYPAVQNIILACRALGLGTTITTNHLRCEAEVKAVLGMPEDVDTFAMMPIGYPVGRFGPLRRRPVSEVTFADRWSQPWPVASSAGSKREGEGRTRPSD